jgi:hypothetical protein
MSETKMSEQKCPKQQRCQVSLDPN